MMNKKEQAQLMKEVSFVILMQDFLQVAPSYMQEKWRTVATADPMSAISQLDESNKQKLFLWGDKWGLDFKKLYKEIKDDWSNISRRKYLDKWGE